MATPRVLVLRAAGTNCDSETAYAFELAGAQVETLHVNQFTRGNRRLSEFQLLAIPGGFTYGDDVSAGRILANEMRCLMADQLQQFLADGKLAIGICNGFQVLVKAGLLPGNLLARTATGGQTVTLTDNVSGRFQCGWVRLKVNESASKPFLTGMDGQIIEVPIAHGEGRFQADPATMKTLEKEQCFAFQYCGPQGEVSQEYNANGSDQNIAGISGYNGHLIGLMPHPERHVHGIQHPRWTREGIRPEGQGLPIFRNAVDYLR